MEKSYLTGNLFLLLSRNLILLRKSDFRKAGLILYTSLLTHFRVLFVDRHPYCRAT